MFGLYTPILILQGFCMYHAYSTNSMQKWYWIILFLPGIGCAIYLYHNFYNRNNIQTLTEGVKQVVNSNYKLEQLEKAHKISDNITTKTNLAEGYIKYGRFPDAVKLYQQCLTGFMADDPNLRMKLLNAHFMNQDYTATVTCGEALLSEKTFKNSEERVAYAWALHFAGKTQEAEAIFTDMNRSFTNYPHRMEYCKFLLTTGNKEMLREISASLVEEFDLMKPVERKFNSLVITQVRALHNKAQES